MLMQTIVTLLQAALALLVSVQGPNVSQSAHDQAVQVAQQAISVATAALSSSVQTPTVPISTTPAQTLSSGGPTSDTERTATLKAIAQSLQKYLQQRGSYPSTLSDISTNGYIGTHLIDSSYMYNRAHDLNTQLQEDFSICTASRDFYKCVSSSIGIDRPFTLRRDMIDNISTSPVTWFTWLPTQNNDDTIRMAFPPGWKRSDADEYARTWELIGQDDAGNTVVVGRFILKNWLPYDSSETLEGFANNIIRTYPSENKLHTTLQSTNGIPSFTAIGNSV